MGIRIIATDCKHVLTSYVFGRSTITRLAPLLKIRRSPGGFGGRCGIGDASGIIGSTMLGPCCEVWDPGTWYEWQGGLGRVAGIVDSVEDDEWEWSMRVFCSGLFQDCCHLTVGPTRDVARRHRTSTTVTRMKICAFKLHVQIPSLPAPAPG